MDLYSFIFVIEYLYTPKEFPPPPPPPPQKKNKTKTKTKKNKKKQSKTKPSAEMGVCTNWGAVRKRERI